ncbi:MAG: hypothetical protein AAFX08_06405 [Pseudomonadota bacterium]
MDDMHSRDGKDGDDALSAYMDGELNADEAAALERRLQTDAALRARLDDLRAVDKALNNAFDLQALEVPASIEAMVAANDAASVDGSGAGGVVPFPKRGRAIRQPFVPAAIAASVALIAGYIAGSAPSTPAPDGGAANLIAFAGPLAADHPIAEALNATPSGSAFAVKGVDAGEEVRPILSFQATDGAFCREFEAGSLTTSMRGVACREDDEAWAVRVAVAGGGLAPLDAAGYATASSADASLIADYVDGVMDGDPLDAEQEAEFISHAAGER